ncbi:MAG TPA: RidA family protein [Longimicrobiales bacterium]|nr:RidA family protein [Longimicrobiales bacterium]
MPESDAILPHGWPRPSGYAHAIARSGRIIAIAGQVGWDPVTREFESDAFVDQARQALRNIVTVVTAAGAQITDVVRLTWYVTDREAYLDNLKSVGNAYRAVFGRHFPAMSVVVVAGLIEPRALVEIEATAVF